MKPVGWHTMTVTERLDPNGQPLGDLLGQQDSEDAPGSVFASEADMFRKLAAGWQPWGVVAFDGAPGVKMRLFYFLRPRN